MLKWGSLNNSGQKTHRLMKKQNDKHACLYPPFGEFKKDHTKLYNSIGKKIKTSIENNDSTFWEYISNEIRI